MKAVLVFRQPQTGRESCLDRVERAESYGKRQGKKAFFPFDPFHDTPCAVMHSIQSSLSPKYVNSDWVLVFGNPRKVLFEVTE